MESILESLKQATSLVDGSLIADPLKSILVGLCDLVDQQQEEINRINFEISHCIQKESFDNEFSEQDKRISEVKTFFSKEISDISSQYFDFNAKIDGIRTEMIKKNNETLTKIQETEKTVENQTSMIFEQLTQHTSSQKALNDKITTKLENLVKENIVTQRKLSEIDLIDSHAIIDRLRTIDDSISGLETTVGCNKSGFDEFKDVILSKNQSYDSFFSKINSEIEEIQLMQRACNPSNENFEIKDVDALIKAVQRNSRRLDGIDQNISSIKLDFGKVTEVVNSYQTVLVTFKYHLYDISKECNRSQNDLDERLSCMSELIDFIGKNILQLYNFDIKGQEKLSKAAEATSKGFESVKNLLMKALKAAFPEFNLMYPVIDDIESLKSFIFEKKCESDVNGFLSKFKKAFEKRNPSASLYKISASNSSNKNHSQLYNNNSNNNLYQEDKMNEEGYNELTHSENDSSDTNHSNANIELPNKVENDKNTIDNDLLRNADQNDTLNKNETEENGYSNCIDQSPRFKYEEEIPKLTDSKEISLKNIECIKDLFFKAEPLRTNLADLAIKVDILSKDFKKRNEINEKQFNEILAKFEDKMDVEFVVKAFEKTTNSMRKLNEKMDELNEKFEHFTKIQKGGGALTMGPVLSRKEAASSSPSRRLNQSSMSNPLSPLPSGKKIQPQQLLYSNQTNSNMNNMSNNDQNAVISEICETNKECEKIPIRDTIEKKKDITNQNMYPAKSAEITPRGRLKMKLPGFGKNKKMLASSSMNSPH